MKNSERVGMPIWMKLRFLCFSTQMNNFNEWKETTRQVAPEIYCRTFKEKAYSPL